MGHDDFGNALVWLRAGRRVAREGWNGKGMWLVLIPGDSATHVRGLGGEWSVLPFIAMKTVQGDLVPWLASQTDVLALDWTVVE